MRALTTLWEFSRPHTIIGSFFSILSLYAISVAVVYPQQTGYYFLEYRFQLATTILSALACNIYITGLNQIQDIDIDKINKPWLPIPAGKLSLKSAKSIVIICGALALFFAFINNLALLILIIIIMGIGTAYSLPPLKFKRHHVAAAASILVVRGFLVNVGMPQQFVYSFTKNLSIPIDIWPLTFFVVGFSLAIAWFKDIPDTGGDAQFNIKTLALGISPLSAFRYGVAVVAVSYMGLMVLGMLLRIQVYQQFFYLIHALLLMLFLIGAARIKINERENYKKSYMVFWAFFFAEYIVYAVAYYL
ncbi:MAG: homogentisate phytyltransferase [Chitinophagaceae bacterium]|jgi:homogentisate phytyltransferase/homogentisate geranylgeranyltransferase|nr:homogentisate phytyltransferase [Chitinophagaceae bacterium]